MVQERNAAPENKEDSSCRNITAVWESNPEAVRQAASVSSSYQRVRL